MRMRVCVFRSIRPRRCAAVAHPLAFAREVHSMSTPSCMIHLVSANLGRLIGPSIPDPVVEAARASLRRPEVARRLRGAWVMAFGDDLHLHLTTFAGDFPAGEPPQAFAVRAAREAA